MTVSNKTACIFGGTGFLGAQIVRELAVQGYRVKVATRVPERAYFLKPCGAVGQVVPYACSYDEKSIQEAVKDCDIVVNLIGLLFEKGRSSFQHAHVDIPEMIAKACKKHKVERFVHVSALGIDKARSKYAKTKLEGESAVHKAFPNATILRPSVIFGTEDQFFNLFAALSRFLPVMPLYGGGKTRFQPVFVGDVADAAIQAITKPTIGDDNPQGKIYELGGPDIVTFEEIYKILFEETGRKRCLFPVPWPVAKLQGRLFSLMPKPLLTADQVESLKTDNVVSEQALGFKDLGINPKAMAVILPTYLYRFRPGGAFSGKKAA